jgi:uracil-DNA glycosylase
MDTSPAPDEIREMREELHRLIDRLPAETLVALWRLVWRWVMDRRTEEGS